MEAEEVNPGVAHEDTLASLSPSQEEALQSMFKDLPSSSASEVGRLSLGEHGIMWKPVECTQDLLAYLHLYGDWVTVAIMMPWVVKLIQIPLTVHVQRQLRRDEPLIEELREREADLQRRFSHDEPRLKMELKALYAKEGNPTLKMMRPLLVPLSLFPVQMSMFLAFRTMHERFPSWHLEGWWWFKDLSVADPTFVLPCAVGFLSAGHMLVVSKTMPDPKQADMMRFIGLVLGGMSIPFMHIFGVGFNVYCLSNIISGMAQLALMRHPAFRKLMGLKPLILPQMTDEDKVQDRVMRYAMALQIVAVGLVLYTAKDLLMEKNQNHTTK